MEKMKVVKVNETFGEKIKRYVLTAGTYVKQHAVPIGLTIAGLAGGAYLLLRKKGDGETETDYVPMSTNKPGESWQDTINRAFDGEDYLDGSDVGPEDDEPEDVI